MLWLLTLKFLLDMLYLPNDDMFVNKFVYCEVPTKAQIFARTGQRAVSASGAYTQDKSYQFGKTPTQSANEFLRDAEAYEATSSESELKPKSD